MSRVCVNACLLITELTDRPFELLGSQTERDQDIHLDTGDSQTKSGMLTLIRHLIFYLLFLS